MINLPEKIIEIKGKKFLFRVESSSKAEDYQKYEELRQVVWEFAPDHLSGSRNLLCENFLHEGSSLFIGVFEEDGSGRFLYDSDHLVGFSYGFAGIKDKSLGFSQPGNIWFYSQFLGVRPDRLNFGLGILIKEFQKEVLLSVLKITTVVCTYDPLTAVNAHRNIRRLGMEVLEYRVAPYGEYGGRLNRQDVPSDRFFACWDLKKKHQPAIKENEMAGYLDRLPRAIEVNYQQVLGRDGPVILEISTGLNLEIGAEQLLVPIPADFYLMLRATQVEDSQIHQIPLVWRLQTRKLFLHYFKKGYEIIDFLAEKGNHQAVFYLLQKKS
ncbi:MAG: hypothetical protein ACPLZD_08385 [Candidatus Saccharicenans sp.]|nr:MAG: hypothetical protein C0168_05005 [Candidatus Aminicenantes bacterium]HEK85362.1 hypothetical protein [Candidatus Aminicenantes bacterium]